MTDPNPTIDSRIESLQKVLGNRLQELEWSRYKLAKEIRDIKRSPSSVNSFDKATKRLLENTSTSTIETLFAAVEAMGGKVVIEFPHEL